MSDRVIIFVESLVLGGIQKVVVDHSTYLIRNNFEVQVVCLKGNGEFRGSLDPQVELLELCLQNLRDLCWVHDNRIWRGRGVSYICHQPKLLLAVKAWMCRNFLFRHGKLHLMLHSDVRYWLPPNKVDFLYFYASVLTSGCVFVPTKSGIEQLGQVILPSQRRKLVLLHNSVSCIGCPDSWSEGSSTIRLVFVGRLTKVKNLAFLIRVLGKVSEDVLWQLDVYGDGEQRSALIKLVEDLGLHRKVKFHGTVFNLGKIYKGKDALVLPSDSEGFGNCVAEALTFGVLPVVNNSSNGPLEIIDYGKYGLVYEHANEQSLSDCIYELATIDFSAIRNLLVNRAQIYQPDVALEPLILKLSQ